MNVFARSIRWLPNAITLLLLGVSVTGCRTAGPKVRTVGEHSESTIATRIAGAMSPAIAEPVESDEAAALLPPDVLTLEQARAIAVRANPDVHAARARLETALARLEEAESRYLPSVTATLNTARTFMTPASRNRLATGLQPSTIVPTDTDTSNLAITSLINALRTPLFGANIGGDTNPFSEHSLAFTVSWTIFDGFIREAQVRAAQHLRNASIDSLADVQRLIASSVDSAYYQVQLAEEQIRIARADEKFSEEQYDETQKLQQAGRATSADVNNFRLRVLVAQAAVTSAIGLRDTGRVLLAELMGLPNANLPDAIALPALTQEAEGDLVLPSADDWIARARQNRPDLLQFESIIESEIANTQIIEGLFLPSVSTSGSWGYDRSSNFEFTEDDQSAALGVEVRWELYTGGRRRAQLRAAQGIKTEAEAQLARLRLAVVSEVRRAIVDLADAQEQIRLQRENIEVARENRRVVLAAYLGGKETLTRLNEAQRDFIAADADLTLARIRLRQAWSDLRTSAGVDPYTGPSPDEGS